LASASVPLLLQPAPAKPGTRFTPANLRFLNTPKDEDDPYLHSPGRGRSPRLYYCSNVSGRLALYVARLDQRGEWQKGDALEGPDPDTENCSPCLTPDGHDLYFATIIVVKSPDKKDAPGTNFDIVNSIKLLKDSQFTAPTPVQSVCSSLDELHPWITADRLELYFSRKTEEGWRVWKASRPAANNAFGPPGPVRELPAGFHHATLSPDGKTMFLQGQLEKNRTGLFRSKRSRLTSGLSSWSDPQALTGLNSPAGEAPIGDMSPCLSRDGKKLYFSSDRRGGKGGRDLWVINAPSLIDAVLNRAK
jgi:hypothetical protein